MKLHVQRRDVRRQRSRFGATFDVRAIAAGLGNHRIAARRMRAQVAWQAQELEGRLKVDFFGLHSLEERDVLGLFVVVRRAALHVWSKAPDLEIHCLARLRTCSQRLVSHGGLVQQFERHGDRQFIGSHGIRKTGATLHLLHKRPETSHPNIDFRSFVSFSLRLADQHAADGSGVDFVNFVIELLFQPRMIVAEVERLQIVDVAHLRAADGIQFVFHLGRESVIHEIGQMGLKEPRNGESHPSRHEGVRTLEDVVPLQNGLDDRGIGAGPTDPLFFEHSR